MTTVLAETRLASHDGATPADDPGMLRDLAELAPAMLWVSNKHGAMTFLNAQYLSFTGLTAEEAKRPTSWENQVHPEDRRHAMNAYVAALEQQRAFSVEYRLRRQDGVYRYVLDLGRPRIARDGAFNGYIGATIDVTERKEQEAEILATSESTARRSRELNLMYELKSDLQVCRSVEETPPVLVKYGEQLFPERRVRVLLHNHSRDVVEPFLAWGEDAAEGTGFAPLQCWALRKGKTHFETPTSRGGICPQARQCGLGRYLCVPMTAFGETIGVMQIDVAPEHAAGGDDTDTIDEIERVGEMAADEIAAAIEELRLRTKLEHQSIRDPLTRLYNRRYFIESSERELNRAFSDGSDVALLMLDLDHFKNFNDTHGHHGGDVVLREFAKILEDAVRGGDVACRYGGEEFAILMLGCPADGALNRAEQIRESTARLSIEHHGVALGGVSTSIGIANLSGGMSTFEQLVAKADAALYAAKERGRNCVVVHGA